MAKKAIQALFAHRRILAPPTEEVRELYNSSRFGMLLEDGKLHSSHMELS